MHRSSPQHAKRKMKKLIPTSPEKPISTTNSNQNSLPLRSLIPTTEQNSNANSYQQNQNQKISPEYTTPQGSQNISKGTFTIPNLGLVYEGAVLNNKFHGEGTLYERQYHNTNRYVYRGSWSNGARNGFGHYIYPDGSQYRGNWLNNMKNGQGSYSNLRGQKYVGQWLENQRHGNGKLELSSHVVLDGQWFSDQFISGRVEYPDGSTYIGELKEYGRNGEGSYQYTDKSRYTGQWLDNMKHGSGEYLFANGDQYNGGFRQNLKHGNGGRYLWKVGGYELVDVNFVGDKYQHGTMRKI